MEPATYKIEGGDFAGGGAASRRLKEQLKQVGADPAVIRRAMVAAYEAEMNVVIHAHRGELKAVLQNGQLEVEVTDEGPGIPDLALALREGYSTASAQARELGFGAGMGLPNIRRNSDAFELTSEVGRGTCVRFTIVLKPQALYGAGRHALQIDAARCKQSLRCVHACPTAAMRVFRGKPEVLDYLCIDCTACIAECPTGTLGTRGTRAELGPTAGRVLVVPASVLVQFDGVPPQRVLNELAGLGFDRVRTTAAWDAALLAAARAHAAMAEGVRPVIAPGCPAVVNVVETKFPGLIPNLAPYVSALEAVRMELAGEPALYVVACPAQRTALADVETTDVILPHVLATAVGPRLAQRVDTPRDEEPRAVPNASIEDVLYVTGIRNVMRVLDAIENGQAEDVSVVDAWACTAGCFGSPLLAQEGHMARQRWAAAKVPLEPTARAVPRTAPFTPRRGLRLDSDMQKAVQKLGRIDKLKRTLPGADCGQCGAPTCAALAEDIVLGRAAADACVRQQPGAPAAQEKQP